VVMVVVSLFLAAGLNPVVEWFMRRGMRRSYAVLAVIAIVILAVTLFLSAIVPVITEQVATLTKNAPDYLDTLQKNRQIRTWNQDYEIVDKVKDYVATGNFGQKAFGGVLGFGMAVLSALLNTFVIVVLTLYFLASLPTTKSALYRLAPASRRERVSRLGDQVIRNVGGYVSGAFIVAMCAGVSSLVFLFAVGLGEYAVALAFVVALLDVIPMIGATLGAIIVTAIGFATDPKIGLFCLVFYIAYQQIENYVIYPRVMKKTVDIPGALTVIAALVGASLLGVVGALLAIPTAASILMLTKEVFIRRQDER
jgi:predicted PurR-regulated permease PerM